MVTKEWVATRKKKKIPIIRVPRVRYKENVLKEVCIGSLNDYIIEIVEKHQNQFHTKPLGKS